MGWLKDGDYFVFPEIFRSEIAAGYDWHELASALVERGMLDLGSDGSIYTQARDPHDDRKPNIKMLRFTSEALGISEVAPDGVIKQEEVGK